MNDQTGSMVNGTISQRFGKRLVICAATISALFGFVLSTIASQIHEPGDLYLVCIYFSNNNYICILID